MENSEAVKAMEAHSPTTPTEQLAEEKHVPDPAVPEVGEAAGIIPQEEASERLSVAGVEFRRPEPSESEEVVVSEPASLSDESHPSPSSEGEDVPPWEAAEDRAESNTLPPHLEGSDDLEPHSLPLVEGEQVPTFEAIQAGEEPHRVSHEEDDELLASKSSVAGIEHHDPVLSEGERSKRTAPLEEDKEDPFVPAEDGAEPHLPSAQPSLLSTLSCHVLVSEGDGVHLSEAFVAEAKCYAVAVPAEHCPSLSPESLRDSNLDPLVDVVETFTSDSKGALVAEHEGVGTNRVVGVDDGTVKKEVDPAPVNAYGSDEVAGYESDITGGKVEAARDGAAEEEVSGCEIKIAGGEVDAAHDRAVEEEVARNEIELTEGEVEAARERAVNEEVAGYEIEMTGGEVEAAHDGDEKEEVDPASFSANGNCKVSGYDIEQAREEVEAVGDEVTGAVESTGEDVETVGSGNVVAEDEFRAGLDLKRRGGKKRKRGRPPSKVQGTRFPGRRKEDEEVCFICFDGGDLVVCDRRGCPKVYHPSCVNRDESYFRSKGQWSCGWHICSECQKSASYMCYTCTYSLCKVCFNVAGFTCIRGKKGFCESCMRTVLLMETSEDAKEMKGGVDFNDRSTWEYLCKDYWVDLKGKLSLTLEELTRARAASKGYVLDMVNEDSSDDGQGSSFDRSSECHDESNYSKKKLKKYAKRNDGELVTKAVRIEGMPPLEGMTSRKIMKKHSRNTFQDSLIKEEDAEVSEIHQENSLLGKAKKRSRKTANEEGIKKPKRRSKRAANENLLRDADKEQITVSDGPDWASKELLEFVSRMKNGDNNILSQYDVQELLLDYIKVNKLRDPRKRSQIICDPMLYTLFGKSRVGHFEMLKLLESHFFIKVSSPASDENQGCVADTDSFLMGTDGSNDVASKMIRRTTRKRIENEPQSNVYDYAAIDVHNINLMYLRRSLMEDLIDDMSTFSEKVIGSFVKIRVSASSQRQEVYRLVQVVGCGKAPEEYRTGKRMTDVMLEIINLDKKEVITTDIISNQEFTEEECRRLRQSIKLGFISRLTVGEVQEKARVLQAVRVSDYLGKEKSRLSHLRDRASEKGKKKELRECVEKLEILITPEENKRRLNEVPEVHTDPKMDPNYESPEDEGDQDEIKENFGWPILSTNKERELTLPGKEGSHWSGVQKSSSNVSELGRARPRDGSQSLEIHSGVAARAIEFPFQEKDEPKSNVETHKIEAKSSPIEACLFNNNEPVRESTVQPEPQLESLPNKVVQQSDASETEKLWLYKDPSGKIQGPFTMMQLRKWSKHFPSNLRIWRKSERQEDSILLTDALAGNFQKDLPEWVPGHINTTQITKINYSTPVVSSVGGIALSSPSLSVISSSKLHKTATSLPICTQQNKDSNSGTLPIPTGQSSLGSLIVHQNTPPQNDKAVSNAASSDIIANLEKNRILESVLKNLTNVNSESTQQASSQLIDMHNQPAVLPYEIDPRKRRVQESGTSTHGNNILSINGDNQQPRTDVTLKDPVLGGHVPQKQDMASLNYDRRSSHGLAMATDKQDDHSTSSTESNTVPEISTCDPSHTRFQNGGALDEKPTVQSNTVESVSPQRSDASTFLKPGSDTQLSAYANSSKQNSGTSVVTSVHSVNAYEQNLSQNGQPSHLGQQTVGSCNWNLPTDTKREQSVPFQNSSTMLCGVSAGVGSTSVNCQSTQLVSPDSSQPFLSPEFNNSTSAVPFQPSNLTSGTGTNEVNNQGWQGPAQYQNFNNVAAAVGNLLCSTGVQGGFGNPNLAWGMMAQGNMNMPWGVVPPNVNVAWGTGVTLPPQASANIVWGAPQGNAMLNEGCRPPLPGNVAPYPFWGSPAQGNSNQNPGWPAPVVGNTNQNAWGAPNQLNTGANNTSGVVQENKVSRWDSAAGNPSGSGMQKEQFRDRDPGSRDGGFRGNRPGYGSERPPRNWMAPGNAEGSPRLPPEQRGICRFFESGHCKKGTSCNYIHSGPMER